MIIKPMIRNNICINSHPMGCAVSLRRQIEYVKKNLQPTAEVTPRLALVIGCSGGYGLSSRIAAAFGYGAATVGISFEKAATDTKVGTPGFYNNMVFDYEAAKAHCASKTIDIDAYSNEAKSQAAAAIRAVAKQANIAPLVDLIIYSLASPVRTDPKTGIQHQSAIKPIGAPFSGLTVNMMDGTLSTVEAQPASSQEIENTVKVMGGEDWELWIESLEQEGLLSAQTKTVAYSYVGPELSWPIYKNGTIGKAKESLEESCRALNNTYGGAASSGTKKIAGAWVSVNKAVVTRASAVIPIIPLYVSCLFKVMKEMGLHEGCVEQTVRLYKDRLYANGGSNVPVDSENRIRIDDWEMRDDVQKAVAEKMARITPENIFEQSDLAGFKHDFLETHGFDVAGVDYNADIAPDGSSIL